MSQTATQPYDRAFFDGVQRNAISAARQVLPIVLRWLPVTSAVDVGCGEGTWLKVLRDMGVTDTLGVDGEYVDRSRLLVPQDAFRAVDLSRPVTLGRRFDLALCMEVGEHLAPEAGRHLVRSLVAAAPAVLFSAAVPGQGGTGHVNEQWPEYWAARFHDCGYVAVDCVRRRVWEQLDDAWWYAQNAVLYVDPSVLASNPGLGVEARIMPDPPLRMVHPKLFWHTRVALETAGRPTVRTLVKQFPKSLAGAVRRRLRWSATPPPASPLLNEPAAEPSPLGDAV